MISATLPTSTHFARVPLGTLRRLLVTFAGVGQVSGSNESICTGWRIAPGILVFFDSGGESALATQVTFPDSAPIPLTQLIRRPAYFCAFATFDEPSPAPIVLPARLQLPAAHRHPDAPVYLLAWQTSTPSVDPQPELSAGGLLSYNKLFRATELPTELHLLAPIPVEQTLLYGLPDGRGAAGGPVLDTEGKVIGMHIAAQQAPPFLSLGAGLTTDALLSQLRDADEPLWRRVLAAQGFASPEKILTALRRPLSAHPQRSALLQAAAVLWDFDPSTLRAEGTQAGDAWRILRQDILPTPTRQWELRPDLRIRTLQGLSLAQLRALRALNPPALPLTPQATVDKVIDADAPLPLATLHPTDLLVLRVVRRWRADLPGIPANLDTAIAHQELFAPLWALTRATVDGVEREVFAGRARELTTLTSYVKGAAPKQALRVTGIGGVGKSALIAKFLLDHPTLPFVWLDFDRPTLRDTDELGLFIELTRQLQAQGHPGGLDTQIRAAHEAIANARREQDQAVDTISRVGATSILEEVTRAVLVSLSTALVESLPRMAKLTRRGSTGGRTKTMLVLSFPQKMVKRIRKNSLWRSSSDLLSVAFPRMVHSVRNGSIRRTSNDLLAAVFPKKARRRRRATSTPRPTPATPLPQLVLALDSYEEVLPVPGTTPPVLGAVLRYLQDALPTLRVLVSGRVETMPPALNGDEQQPILLTGLDDDGARALLDHRRVMDEEDRRILLSLAEGNPLLLKLGIDFVKLRGPGRLRDSGIHREVSTELSQGMLYRRLLGHIKDGAAQEVTESLLVLRRFDPALLGVITGRNAEAIELFERLKILGSMYKSEADDRLEVRSDVRRTALVLLTRTHPERVKQVDEAALLALLARPTPQPWERAEALFHRLRLGHPEAELDAVWSDELRGFFPPTILEELPEAAQRWLRRRTTPLLFVPDEDPEAQAHALMVQLRELIEADNYSRADALLQQQPLQRNIDPELDLQVALIHLALGRTDEARRWLPDAVPDVVMEDVRQLAELELLELLGSLQEFLQRIPRVIESFDPPIKIGLLAHTVVACRYPLDPMRSEENTTPLERLLDRHLVQGAQSPFLTYVAAAADPKNPTLLRQSILLAGTSAWGQADIDAAWTPHIAPRQQSLLSFTADALQFLHLTPTNLPEADLRAVLLKLPDLNTRQRPWLTAMVERVPGLAEVLIRLTLQAERGSIWRRLRAALLSPMDS